MLRPYHEPTARGHEMPASEYLEQKILGHIFGDTAYTRPTALHVGLLTATPADEGGMVEVAAAEYARIQRDPGDVNWIQQADGRRINATAIEFPDPLTDWGTVTAVGIFDAATDGNLICYTLLDAPKTVLGGGATFIFQPGANSWRMNDL
jgi:hypothetical protein